ncbi:cytochrome b5-related protein-like [Cylas formicarius]|uniref:cytochrome b5-related protein-like n=1 Tax=Cylas formicarius TaxID=197179 RepID=UPI0029589B1C|nr:cytochrome b5-related protein-like [Cylas formicarius]XP_060522313.1 cytochrome b5-related protein-like [Cylas formicarius]
MPPNAESYDNYVPKSTLGIKPPPRRSQLTTVYMWLEDKKEIDNAEGLWRIHDGIYDFTDFVKSHPGGSDWLTLSKGLDITEAFEVHHLTALPEELLSKYFVRKAKSKRNAPFTFKEDGFYKTLKREVKQILPTIPKQAINTTNFLIDSILVGMFILSILAAKYWNFFLATLAGNFVAFLAIAAHNYFHQKDNFRMYYFQFSLLKVKEWRLSHVLSHHLHTNTIDDYEISVFEPLLQYMSVNKTPLKKYGQLLLLPIIWITGFHRAYIARLIEHLKGTKIALDKSDLIPFILPAAMYIFGGQSLLATFGMWNYIILVGSTHLFVVGQHAAHHHPDIFHDGDEPRSKDDYDWGVSQLDAVMERKEITGSHFLVLTNFGDHALHHLFPTLDHGTLTHIYPVFKKVMDQFDVNLMMVSQVDTVFGAFQQLVKEKPNTSPPNLHKYKFNLKN